MSEPANKYATGFHSLQERSRQRAEELKRRAKEPETDEDRRNLLITLRSCGLQARDKVRGAL